MAIRKLTPEQERGTKFEIWGELLLQEIGYKRVRRNVQYHRQRYVYRQVDLEFKEGWKKNLVILELKYCNNGKVNLKLRSSRKFQKGRKSGTNKGKAGQLFKTIEDIVIETEERRRFVKARRAILMTNQYFSDDVYQKAEMFPNLKIYDLSDLMYLERNYGTISKLIPSKGSIREQINSINLRQYRINAISERI